VTFDVLTSGESFGFDVNFDCVRDEFYGNVVAALAVWDIVVQRWICKKMTSIILLGM
jgi:hypothetical protein